MATIRQLLENHGRSGLFGDGELRRWKTIERATPIFCHGDLRARAEATIFGHGGNLSRLH